MQQGMERYVDHLCREIAATPVAHTGPAAAHSEAGHHHPVPRTPLRTVFFGGGTPSLAGPHLSTICLSAVHLYTAAARPYTSSLTVCS